MEKLSFTQSQKRKNSSSQPPVGQQPGRRIQSEQDNDSSASHGIGHQASNLRRSQSQISLKSGSKNRSRAGNQVPDPKLQEVERVIRRALSINTEVTSQSSFQLAWRSFKNEIQPHVVNTVGHSLQPRTKVGEEVLKDGNFIVKYVKLVLKSPHTGVKLPKSAYYKKFNGDIKTNLIAFQKYFGDLQEAAQIQFHSLLEQNQQRQALSMLRRRKLPQLEPVLISRRRQPPPIPPMRGYLKEILQEIFYRLEIQGTYELSQITIHSAIAEIEGGFSILRGITQDGQEVTLLALNRDIANLTPDRKTFSRIIKKYPRLYYLDMEKYIGKTELLKEFSQKSKISNEFELIDTWIEQSMKEKAFGRRLLYRASDHDFCVKRFHWLCDSVKNTIVLIHTEHDIIIGGFSPASWQSIKPSGFVSEPRAFIFSLNTKKVRKINQQTSIFLSQERGPGFGHHNILIKFQKLCVINLPLNFYRKSNSPQQPIFSSGISASKTIEMKQWEVYEILL